MQTNAMPVRLLGIAMCVVGIVALRTGPIDLGACAFVLGLTVVSTDGARRNSPVLLTEIPHLGGFIVVA